MRSVAAPIRNGSGEVVAAVSVAGPCSGSPMSTWRASRPGHPGRRDHRGAHRLSLGGRPSDRRFRCQGGCRQDDGHDPLPSLPPRHWTTWLRSPSGGQRQLSLRRGRYDPARRPARRPRLPLRVQRRLLRQLPFRAPQGEVMHNRINPPAWTDRDRQRKRYLGCQARALSDCRIKVNLRDHYKSAHRPLRLTARLFEIEDVTHDIRDFRFHLSERAPFLPGQYALLSIPGVVGQRPYSMCNVTTAAPRSGISRSSGCRTAPRRSGSSRRSGSAMRSPPTARTEWRISARMHRATCSASPAAPAFRR